MFYMRRTRTFFHANVLRRVKAKAKARLSPQGGKGGRKELGKTRGKKGRAKVEIYRLLVTIAARSVTKLQIVARDFSSRDMARMSSSMKRNRIMAGISSSMKSM